MNGGELRRTVTIRNSQGLHMRPITTFVETATKFLSTISVCKEGQPKVNGKSPLAMLSLAAEQGTLLVLEADGPDAQQALDALENYINEQLPKIEP